MGLFSFVKNAGAKLFGLDDKKEEAAAADAAAANAAKEAKIHDFVRAFDLKIDNFQVICDGDMATLRGEAHSQAEKEKLVLAVGNINGIATVDDQMTVEAPEPEAQFYTVVSGDSLSKIAKKYYGDAMKYPTIFEANKPMLDHPDKIYPGQTLRIPPLS